MRLCKQIAEEVFWVRVPASWVTLHFVCVLVLFFGAGGGVGRDSII